VIDLARTVRFSATAIVGTDCDDLRPQLIGRTYRGSRIEPPN
jgi:hypothetical protein